MSLRPHLVGLDIQRRSNETGQFLLLSSRGRLCDQCLQVPIEFGPLLSLFDGEHTLEDIEGILRREGVHTPPGFLDHLTTQLDAICVLDGPHYREQLAVFRGASVRPAMHAGGAYFGEPAALRGQIQAMYRAAEGPGEPGPARGDDLCAIFSPHIDFNRGGPSFSFGYREVIERSSADLFVILATSHYSHHRFILTRKHFDTPLGRVETDIPFVESLAGRLPGDPFEDEVAHQPEHSIEFQAVLLQHALGAERTFRIVPILVGSFQDAVESGVEPLELPDIRAMVEGLRETGNELGRRICWITSGDLAHIGPKFGDDWQVDDVKSRWCRVADLDLLRHLESGDPSRLFDRMRRDGDERRICGFPPAYVMLSAMGSSVGKTLHYDQYVDPAGHEIVSFASVGFYRPEATDSAGAM